MIYDYARVSTVGQDRHGGGMEDDAHVISRAAVNARRLRVGSGIAKRPENNHNRAGDES
jgi:hypothetical protein